MDTLRVQSTHLYTLGSTGQVHEALDVGVQAGVIGPHDDASGAPLGKPGILVTTMPSLRTLATTPKPCGVLMGSPACSGVIFCLTGRKSTRRAFRERRGVQTFRPVASGVEPERRTVLCVLIDLLGPLMLLWALQGFVYGASPTQDRPMSQKMCNEDVFGNHAVFQGRQGMTSKTLCGRLFDNLPVRVQHAWERLPFMVQRAMAASPSATGPL